MRKIYIVILLIVITNNINAQNKESPDLNSIVDYVTCVCVNDALPENKKIDCDKQQLTQSIIPEEEKSTISLFNEFQKLKEKTNINDNLIFFTEDIFTKEKQFSKIYAFAEKRKKENKFAPLKSKIEKFIQNKGTNETNTNLNSDQPNSSSGNSENAGIDNPEHEVAVADIVKNNTTPPQSSAFFSFNFWTLFLTFLFLIVIALHIILSRKISAVEKNLENKFGKIKNDNSRPLSSLPIDYSSKIKNLENQIRDVEYQLKNSIQKNLSNNIVTDSTIPKINNEVKLEVPPKPIQEVFYMATPDQNNFDISSLSNTFKPTQSLYEFKVDNYDKSKASFTFYSDEIGIRDAVNYPHTYLDPVCESQNALNQNAKSINTIKPGIAEKRNDKWVVTTKAKIKYE
jgi:hypothetical protein